MSKDQLIINEDGTVTDSETLLMWTASTFGKSSDGTICEGGLSGFTWNEATRLFGCGRDIRRNMDESEITRETYEGYKFSKLCPVAVGGHNDWRLPTVEEIRTLIHKEVFGEGGQLWTANFSGLPDAGSGGRCAWMLHWDKLAPDTGTGCVMPVRLVREGSVFNSIFGQRNQIFQIHGGNTFLSQSLAIPISDIREVAVEKRLAGSLLSLGVGVLCVGVLIVLLLLWFLSSLGGYLLIPALLMLLSLGAYDLLADKTFYVLRIQTPYKRFHLTAEKEKLKIMEQAIKAAKSKQVEIEAGRCKGEIETGKGKGEK